MVLSPSPQIHLVPFDFILFYHSYRESLNQKYFFQNVSVIRVIRGVNIINFPFFNSAIYNDLKLNLTYTTKTHPPMIEREEESGSSVPSNLSESLDPRGSLWLDKSDI